MWPQGGAQAPFQDCLLGWERLAQSGRLTGLAFLCLSNQPPTRESQPWYTVGKQRKAHTLAHSDSITPCLSEFFFPLTLARAVWTLA